MAGSYEILDIIGNSYKVKLPKTIKVHPAFSPDRLRKAANNFLPEQKNDPALPIQINGDDEWEVEKILVCKFVRGMLKYRVRWKGYDPDPVWYCGGDGRAPCCAVLSTQIYRQRMYEEAVYDEIISWR
jgi:hypothetical protein